MKRAKKFLSLMLVLAMVFSLAVPVFAEEASVTASLVSDVSSLATGDKVVIYNQQYKKALNSSGTSGYYNSGIDIESSDGKLADIPENIVWEVTVNEDGTYFFMQSGKKLSMDTDYSSMPYDKVNDKWTISENSDGTCYIMNVERKCYVEWYADKNYFSAYKTIAEGSEGMFAMNIYKLDEATEPVDPPVAGELDGKTVILHTNDVHGAVDGYAYITALKAEYEAKGAEVILADAGDYSQGTTYVSTTKGLDAIKMMNEAGYDVATIGNHEFDYGYEQLKTNAAEAAFKIVCADVLDENGAPVFDANTIIEKGGVKIGFFGLETPEAQTKANPALIKGLVFPAADELYACAAAQVAALKEQGADVIICLAHLGVDAESNPNRSVDLAANVEGIDFIVDGHSHTVMTAGPNGEKIQSTGTAFANIGVIVIDNATKAIESNELVAKKDFPAADETVAAAAQVIIDRINAEYGEVFAKSEVELNGAKSPNGNRDSETNLGDLITDSMLWTVLKDEGSISVPAENVVAITNGGGIRAWIHAGDITKKDVNTVLPFGNTIAVVYVTGAELLEALEASTYCTPGAVGGFPQVAGINFVIATCAEYDANEETYPNSTYHGPASINRVWIDNINGQPFDEDATYAVVTNNFVAAGGDTYYAFAAASAQFDTGIPMDEALMAYITEELGGVIGEDYAEPQGRFVVTDEHLYENGICVACGDELEATFSDVKPGSWYFDYVEIAAYAGLVNGRTPDTFVPNANMTRAEFATILYRIAGEDKAKMGEIVPNFKDVKDGQWFAEAVNWAASWGIVNGYPGGSFKPNGTITRQEIAVMLMRFNEFVNPADDIDTGVLDSFADGAKVPDWSKDAMAWAVQEGIISGMDGKLAPTGLATRAQVATMMVRYLLSISEIELPQNIAA